MLPAADFITVRNIWGTFTWMLLLEPLFLHKKLKHTKTNLSNLCDGGRLQFLPGHKQMSCVYVYSTSLVAHFALLYRKQNLILTSPLWEYTLIITNGSSSGK